MRLAVEVTNPQICPNRRRDTEDHSLPVASFAGAVLATVNDYRRRRWEARFPGVGEGEGWVCNAVMP